MSLLEKDELLVECVNKKVDTTKEKSNTSSVVSTETEDQPTEKETRTKEEDVMEIVEIEEMRKGGNDEPDTIHRNTRRSDTETRGGYPVSRNRRHTTYPLISTD